MLLHFLRRAKKWFKCCVGYNFSLFMFTSVKFQHYLQDECSPIGHGESAKCAIIEKLKKQATCTQTLARNHIVLGSARLSVPIFPILLWLCFVFCPCLYLPWPLLLPCLRSLYVTLSHKRIASDSFSQGFVWVGCIQIEVILGQSLGDYWFW